MRYRQLGRTGETVSEIGFGAWGIGKGAWGPADDGLSIRALCRAFELGFTFIDTALGYGDGESERLIARAFREYRERCLVATKVPRKAGDWPPKPGTPARVAFPPEWIVECTERSLRNLRADVIDLQQLHLWTDEWLQDPGWQDAVARLRDQGKIRRFGVSVIDHRPETALELVRSGLADTVQVIYNIFDQSPAAELLPLCQARGVGVIARVPFDEGSLAGRLTPETVFHDFRRDYFRGERLRETCERVERLRFLVRDEIGTLAQAALKFCLSHPAVSTVIPGMRRPEHVEENCAASDGIPLRPDELEALKAHAWPRNFYL
ncbi:MAG: aldo/keto reductase [Candidatus Rokubacteria bacterium]|nr:aldo/keto reductase [Candidatus Rokubacteria bacterium]